MSIRHCVSLERVFWIGTGGEGVSEGDQWPWLRNPWSTSGVRPCASCVQTVVGLGAQELV